jgi:hypothetical protein
MEPCDSRDEHRAGANADVPLSRTTRHLEDVAGVVRNFRFEPTDSESRSGVDVRAKVTHGGAVPVARDTACHGPLWAIAQASARSDDPRRSSTLPMQPAGASDRVRLVLLVPSSSDVGVDAGGCSVTRATARRACKSPRIESRGSTPVVPINTGKQASELIPS